VATPTPTSRSYGRRRTRRWRRQGVGPRPVGHECGYAFVRGRAGSPSGHGDV